MASDKGVFNQMDGFFTMKLGKLLLVLVCFISSGCNESPATNTQEYLAMHGIAPGKKVIIDVAGKTLKIPAEFRVLVETNGEINRGKADIVRVYLRPSDLMKEPGSYKSFVRIEFREGGIGMYEEAAWVSSEKWQESAYLEEVGLKEYIKNGDQGGFGYVTYYSSDFPNEQNLKNTLIKCQGRNGRPSGLCKGRFFKNGLTIWYFFEGNMISHWKDLVSGIHLTVSEFIME